MKKCLIIGDAHFKANDINRAVLCLEWIKQVISEEKPDLIVNLGDLFNDHGNLRCELLKIYIDFIKDVTKTTPYYHIIGNHELYKAGDSKYNALQTYKGAIPNFTVVDEVIHDDMADVSYIPYLVNCQDFPKTTKSIVFAHQSFLGANWGFIKDKTSIDPKEISGAKVIISGHIHIRGQIDNVYFPGSIYAQDQNDIDQIKGIMIFDKDTYNMRYIDSPFPMWKKISFDVEPSMQEDIVSNITKTVDNKNIWVVELTGYKTDILGIINSPDIINIKKDRKLKFKPHFLDSVKKEKQITAKNTKDAIKEYILNVYSGIINKDSLLRSIEGVFVEVDGENKNV